MHLGLALTFAEDPKIFITKTGCKAHLKVLSADLYGLCCILEQSSLIQIHQKLSNSSMQFSYKRQSCKTFSVEQGYVDQICPSLNSPLTLHHASLCSNNIHFIFHHSHLQTWVDISTKQSFSSFWIVLHKNTSFVGSYTVECYNF